jgi:hypothetical protein
MRDRRADDSNQPQANITNWRIPFSRGVLMTDELKKIYSGASKMDRYFDSTTPCELFRGVPKGSKVALMQPTLVGFYKRKQDPANPKAKIPDLTQGRHPDVLVTDAKTGNSPQYGDGTTAGRLNEEHRTKMEITAEMVKNSGDYMVRGCRTMKAADHSRLVTVQWHQ